MWCVSLPESQNPKLVIALPYLRAGALNFNCCALPEGLHSVDCLVLCPAKGSELPYCLVLFPG